MTPCIWTMAAQETVEVLAEQVQAVALDGSAMAGETESSAESEAAAAAAQEEGQPGVGPSSSSDGPAEESASPHVVVLVGITGEGKSTTGNTLSRTHAFAVSDGLSSATQGPAHIDYIQIDATGFREYRVVDTIGLHDTSLPAAEVMRRFSAFSDSCPAGIDVFLFVMKWGRFRPDHEAAFDAFRANCGEAVLSHTVLCFTACPLAPADLQAKLESDAVPPALRRVLPLLAAPAVAVENLRYQNRTL